MRRFLCALLALPLLSSLAVPARAADRKEIEQRLKETYQGRVLTLRNFYGGKKLQFNSDGELVKGGKTGPWTVSGRVEIRKVKLRRDKLQLDGRRIYVVYDDDKKEFQQAWNKEKLRIELSLTKGMIHEPSIRHALEKVFLSGKHELMQELPDYWKDFLSDKKAKPLILLKTDEIPLGRLSVRDKLPYRIGGDVAPPVCTYCPDPEFTQAARQVRVDALLVLWAEVNERGTVEDVRIIKPFGLGLDDAAVETCRRWVFEPAMRRGKPVRVYMTIEITFYRYSY